MEFGIKLTPYNLAFVYDKKIDEAVSIRRSKEFSTQFNEYIWYTVAILLKNDQVELSINCGELHFIDLDINLFDNFDLYGRMYLGADTEDNQKQATVSLNT